MFHEGWLQGCEETEAKYAKLVEACELVLECDSRITPVRRQLLQKALKSVKEMATDI